MSMAFLLTKGIRVHAHMLAVLRPPANPGGRYYYLCLLCDSTALVNCQAGEDVLEEAFKVMFKQHGANHSLETLLVLSKARAHLLVPALDPCGMLVSNYERPKWRTCIVRVTHGMPISKASMHTT